MSDDLERFERTFRASTQQIARLKNIQHLLMVGLVVVILGFLFALFTKLRGMYRPQQFQPHLQVALDDLGPKMAAVVVRALREAAPTYVREGREQFQAALPEFQERAEEEWQEMTLGLHRIAEERIHGTLDKLVNKHKEELAALYPGIGRDLEDPLVLEKWRDTVWEDAKDIAADFQERFGGEVVHLYDTLEGFYPNRFQAYGKDDLLKRLLHGWLMLADHHLMAEVPKVREVSHAR
jgi:hypothetical protein